MNIISKAFDGNNIRIIADSDGEPWFVASDIAMALEYGSAKDMTRWLDDDEKGGQAVPTLGGAQTMTVISESGLYSAIMRSRKPEAKRFKKWVTSEVLPSLRKHGGYIAGQEQDSPELIMAKALMLAQSVIDRKSQELNQAKEIIEAQKPAVLFSEQVSKDSKGVLLELYGKAVGIGRNKLFKILRSNKVLISTGKSRNLPYQEYIDRGYFSTKESTYDHNGKTELRFTPLITGNGQQWLTCKLIDSGDIKAVSANDNKGGAA